MKNKISKDFKHQLHELIPSVIDQGSVKEAMDKHQSVSAQKPKSNWIGILSMLVVCEPDQGTKHQYSRRNFDSGIEENVDTIKNDLEKARIL